jgi:hypothetical protein
VVILEVIAAAAGRDKPGEVERQVDCACDLPSVDDWKVVRWPRLDQTRIAQAIRANKKIEFSVAEQPTDEILEALYPGNPLLCVGRSVYEYNTTRRQEIYALSLQQFIVPNPMSRPVGKTIDGKESCKCNDNTGPRKYLIVEFDTTPLDTQPALIAWLAYRWREEFPLIMIVHSGGKSLHAWFGVENKDPLSFFRQAVSMGADKKLWTVSQFVRMPQGLRQPKDVFGKPKCQFVIYFNPFAL